MMFNDSYSCTAYSIKAISHPLRLKILCMLGNQELSVQELLDKLGTTQSNLSQHLATLRNKAKYVMYKINDERTLNMIYMMRDIYCEKSAA